MDGSNEDWPENGASWCRSSFSEGANECVEVAMHRGRVAVRDSKNPAGPVLRPVLGWRVFLGLVTGVG